MASAEMYYNTFRKHARDVGYLARRAKKKRVS